MYVLALMDGVDLAIYDSTYTDDDEVAVLIGEMLSGDMYTAVPQ